MENMNKFIVSVPAIQSGIATSRSWWVLALGIFFESLSLIVFWAFNLLMVLKGTYEFLLGYYILIFLVSVSLFCFKIFFKKLGSSFLLFGLIVLISFFIETFLYLGVISFKDLFFLHYGTLIELLTFPFK